MAENPGPQPEPPPGGRVAVSTWCDLELSGFAPFPAVFAGHIPELPAFVRATAHRGGFREVRTGQRTDTVRYGSAAAWARAFLGAASGLRWWPPGSRS